MDTKGAGFTLEDIRQMQSGVEEELLLQKKKTQLLAKIAELTRQIAVIDAYLLDETASLRNPVPLGFDFHIEKNQGIML